jgi:hypothetical protein
MKILLTTILCFAASSVFSQYNNNPEKKQLYQFVLLAHGLSASKTPVTHKKDSSAWGDGPYQFFKVIQTTDSVPAKLNTVFGIEYKLTGIDNPDVHYTEEWLYPSPLKESDGRKYASYKTNGTISVNKNNSCSYVLEKPNELLKGTWTLNLYIEGKLLFSHKFIVY